MNENRNIDNQLIISCVLGYAIGDALGVPVEFLKREELKEKNITDMIGYGSHNQPEGTWSDDTAMVLATMDSIAERKEIIYKDIMDKYILWFKQAEYTASKEVFDIGYGTRRALELYDRGTKLEKCGSTSYMNNGNGSLMRMLPIALYTYSKEYDYKKEIETTYYFSSLTHGHNISMMGCKIYSDFIRELLNGNSPVQALNNLSKYPYDKYYDDFYLYERITSGKIANLNEQDIKSSGFVVDTLEATIWCLINSSNYEEAVLKAINLGEDTDTIAALTGALAGIVYGYNSIPQKWIEKLKNKDFLLKLCNSFNDSLKKKYNINIPKPIKDILKKITEQGYEAYLVGGAVRDAIIGKENKDYDLCTNMPLPLVKELFPSFVIMKPNNHRNTGIIRINDIDIEISEFRGKNLTEDLSNRDFTINAIAADLNGNVIDPFDGISALYKQEISLIKKDGEAFTIDPLRIMRAIRLAAQMNFNIDENCKLEMNYKKELLSNVPVERIYRELIQLLVTEKPSKYIRENKDIFFEILPELQYIDGFEQHNDYHTSDIFEHTLLVLENTKSNIYLRLAALFHDIGKPKTFFIDENGVGHFYGHPQISSKIFENIANRLKMDNKSKKEVKKLIEFHDYPLDNELKHIYAFFKKYGTSNIDLLFELKEADIKGQNPQYRYRLENLYRLKELYTQILATNPCLSIKNLKINGNMLKEKGIPSKQISTILEEVLEQVMYQGLSNTEEQLAEYIERKYK